MIDPLLLYSTSAVQIYHKVYLYSQLCTFCLQYNCTVYHRLAIVEPWSRVARDSQGWPWQALVRHITPSKSYPWCLWPPATKDSQGWPWQSLVQDSQSKLRKHVYSLSTIHVYSQLYTVCPQYICTVNDRLAMVEGWSRVTMESQCKP